MATRRSTRKQQTRLQFAPLSSSSPVKVDYSESVQSRLANVRFEGAKVRRSSRNVHEQAFTRSPRLPTPEASSQIVASKDSPLYNQQRSAISPTSKALRHTDSDSAEDEDDDLVLPSTKRRRVGDTASHQTQNHITPTRQSSRLQPGTTPPSHSSLAFPSNQKYIGIPNTLRELSGLGSAETSGDEDNLIITRPPRRRQNERPIQEDPFVVPDEEIEYRSSDQEIISKSKRPSKTTFVVDDDEAKITTSDDEEVAPRTLIKSRHGSKRRARKRREQAELDDDLKDLQDSDTESVEKIGRTRGGPVNTQRDKAREHFELLKRRRAGEKAPRIIDSDDEEFEDNDGVDIDYIGQPQTSYQEISDNEGSLSTQEEAVEPDVHENADDADDFIVDDTEVDRFGKSHPDIPLEFTSFVTRKPRELFIHIIEWLVKNKIAPAFPREDELYNLAWDRVNAQIKGQAGSRLISAAWNAEFKNAVLARPEMTVTYDDNLEDEDIGGIRTCDACNRTNHPAKYVFAFSGQAYFQDSLEPVENSDDEDEDQDVDNDAGSYDAQGHLLPAESTRFYLGRFCAANAEMGHKLSHWKHQLNKSLLAYLEEQGVLSAEAIVSREKLNKKKREKEAESIVDIMEETGMIAKLWQELQDDLEDARFGMEGHEKTGGRSKARIGAIRASRAGRIEEWSEGGKRRVIF